MPCSLAQMNAFPHAQSIGWTSPDSTIAALPGLSTDAQRHGNAVGIGRRVLEARESEPRDHPIRPLAALDS
jgi:hypothetical protein